MRSTALFPIACCLASLAAHAGTDAPALEVSPSRVKLRLGEGRQLSARLKGKPGGVRWLVEGPGAGTVTPSGFYHAPAQAATPATVRVQAVAEADASLKAEALVFLEPVAVAVRPAAVSLATAQTYQFRGEVDGTGDQRLRWSVEGGPGHGAITESGLFSAPSSFLTPGTITVRATAVADPTKSDTAQVRLGEVSIQVKPAEVSLQHGRSARFTAKVSGSPHAAVHWNVLGQGMGEVSGSGLYTPPPSMATPAVVTVVASSAADPSKTATARVRIEAIQIGPAAGKRGGRKKGFVGTAGSLVRSAVGRVARIYMPFNPLDFLVRGPVFRGKSGKQYVPLGGAVALDAAVTHTTNDRIRWELEGSRIGRLSEDGFYEAPDTLTTPQVIQIRATSLADPTKTILQTLHIPPVVVEGQEEATCAMDGAVQLRARVENTENDRLRWSVEGGSQFGAVSDTGLYQPPASMSTPAVVRVRAASDADPTKFATVQIKIPEVRLEVSPDEASVRPGQSLRLKASVRGGPAEVIWSLVPEIGTVTADGVYHAPADGAPRMVQVRAVARADPTKTAIISITLKER